MRRKNNVSCLWTPELAYAIGVITTDGNLSATGRHINVTSKDREMVENVKKLLKLENKIGRKARGYSLEKKYYVLQFGDTTFYEFLQSIGLMRAKSKKLKEVKVPECFFVDFLRGCIDGDGTMGSFKHPESKHPQIRVRLCSASHDFLAFMLSSIRRIFSTIDGGHIYALRNKSAKMLSFGKADSVKILQLMYYAPNLPALSRKRKLAESLIRASGAIG